MFMNLAHRGASAYAPENTMSAFFKGIELGANGIETDLKITKDDILFLHHDDNLCRTTNGNGRPCEHTWEDLQHLDAGSWFSPQFKGEKLVSFEQFAYFFGAKDLLFSIELKDRHIEEHALAIIRRYIQLEKVTITSFHYEDLVNVRERDADVQLGYLVEEINAEVMEKGRRIKINQICPRAKKLRSEHVHDAKASGLVVRAWGVSTEEIMHHAIRCEVDGMTINFPDKAVQFI